MISDAYTGKSYNKWEHRLQTQRWGGLEFPNKLALLERRNMKMKTGNIIF